MKQFKLAFIKIEASLKRFFMEMQSLDGENSFNIYISEFQAESIYSLIKGEECDLEQDGYYTLNKTLDLTDRRIEYILIDSVTDGLYTAKLSIVNNQEKPEAIYDIRPTDAISLSFINKLPIFVNKSVFQNNP